MKKFFRHLIAPCCRGKSFKRVIYSITLSFRPLYRAEHASHYLKPCRKLIFQPRRMRMRMLIRECTAVRTSIDRKSCSLRSFESGWGSNTHCSRRPCDDDKNIPSSSRPGVEPCVLGYPVPAREGCSDGPDSFRNRSGDSAWKQRPARRGQTARGEPVETQEFSIHERCRASCLAPLAQAIHDASESVQHGKHAIGLQPGHRQLAHGSGR